jgi:SNF2 family DNA or RNA helicase
MIVAKEKKALVLRLRNPDKITTLIPAAKKITHKGQTLVAVPHNQDAVKLLRNIGIQAPPPIKYYYKWKGSKTPFAAQESTAAFLTLHSRAFVHNEIGTGKTLSVLWAYDYLRWIGKMHKMLVIAPLSTLEPTWGREVFQNFPHLNYAVLHGTRKKRLALLEQDADVYIINPDGVETIAAALDTRPDIDLVVIDEISKYARNASTAQWKTLNHVVNKPIRRSAWGLTGTPTPNAPTDAWAQAKLLVPENTVPYFSRFRDLVMRQAGPYKWVPRDNALDVVHAALQPAIRFTRDECIDLPECLRETREVELTPEQHKAYKQMMSNLHAEFESGQITAVNQAVKMSKLLQIVCGVAYSNDGTEISIPSHSRLQAVLEVVEEASSKVLVYVPFVSSVNKVAEFLTSKNISVELVHGGISKHERDRIFKSFQNSKEPRVLVAQPACLSHGLTLTAANTIVWYAPITSNDIAVQAEGRITRPGQKNAQLIVQLEGTPLERKMYQRLKDKQNVQNVLLEMVKLEGERV